MMKLYKYAIVVGVLIFACACTDNFDEINKNPNRLTSSEPENIFGLTTVKTMRLLGEEYNWLIFGNFTNQISFVGGSYPNFGHDDRSSGLWEGMYVDCLFPLYEIIKNYENNPAYTNRVNIARIWKCYIISQAVALWGPVPYSQACTGKESIPYDSEEAVYRGLLAELQSAYTNLDIAGDTYPSNAEPFLNSDIARWKLFAHALRLRIALRIADVEESVVPGLAQFARTVVTEELDAPENLPASNKDNFYLTYTSGSSTTYQNPYETKINAVVSTLGDGNFPVIHESLILYMSPDTYNDPRISKLMKKVADIGPNLQYPDYFGRPSTGHTPENWSWITDDIHAGTKKENYCWLGTEFASPTAKCMILSYPEICCMRAEAKYKGYWEGTKTAEEYYYEAIDAGCARYDISAANTKKYKDAPGIQWSTESDTIHNDRAAFYDRLGLVSSYMGVEDNYKRIALQYWINFFYQGIDSYTLLRRTQELQFPPHWNCDQATAYVKTRYAYIPQRLVYPRSEINLNKKEMQNAINMLTDKNKRDELPIKLIFCKDVKDLTDPTGYLNYPLFGDIYPNSPMTY
jgi:hypothetical protein